MNQCIVPDVKTKCRRREDPFINRGNGFALTVERSGFNR
jgi:hypothetical protein